MTEERNCETHNYFLISWTCYGVEAVIDITEDYRDEFDDAQYLLEGNTKKREPSNTDRLLHGMLMRARFNTDEMQVYGLLAEKCITREDLWEWGQRDPQGFADMVREKGVSFWEPRKPTSDIKIV